MRFVFGYAGIPRAVFDVISKKQKVICGDNSSFTAQALRAPKPAWTYVSQDIEYLQEYFSNLLSNDHENKLADTGFGLIYVNYPDASTQRLIKKFFPSVLCVPVEWKLDARSEYTIHRSANELSSYLRLATNHAKEAIALLKKEVVERDGRTHLLLPVKNFHCDNLASLLEGLQRDMADAKDKNQVLKDAKDALEVTIPRHQAQYGKRIFSYFVDDRNIEFQPPGRVGRHAFARRAVHLHACFLSAHRRFGAPYEPAFHYDCTRGAHPLKDTFFGCHEPSTKWEGKPHLNISPNDFVRG